MKHKVLKVNPKDNVIVALANLSKGDTISFEGEEYILQDNINAKHKFFTKDLNTGDEIIMYGVLVGKAQSFIPRGGLMTTTNTKHAADRFAYRAAKYEWHAPDVSKFKGRTFNGYHRSDGRVGTANYWLFIPTVFCENRNLDVIREAMWNELGYAVTDRYKQFTHQMFRAHLSGNDIDNIDLNPIHSNNTDRYFKNVDGIKFLNHSGGCGCTRQDSATLGALLVSYADHPNVGGVTLLSLGCQHLQVKNLLNDLKQRNPSFNKPLYVFEQQQIQSEEQLITDA